MKKKCIRFLMDYKCYPVWVIDEMGCLEGPGLPEEMEGDKWLAQLLDEIQKDYELLFTDTEKVFEVRDFTKEEKERFDAKVALAIQRVRELAGDKYEIQNDIEV